MLHQLILFERSIIVKFLFSHSMNNIAMFIPIWLFVLVVLFLSITISYYRKLFKKWKVLQLTTTDDGGR